MLYPQNKKDLLYIKLFDRLHNMQTISFMPEVKRNRIVDETIEYFVSLCSILGLYQVKKELIMLSYNTKLSYQSHVFASDKDTLLINPFSS